MTKSTYLAVYDYGQGGVWVLLDARSPDGIEAKYPELKVVRDRPHWLTKEHYSRIEAQMHFDVDALPTGWLSTPVESRS